MGTGLEAGSETRFWQLPASVIKVYHESTVQLTRDMARTCAPRVEAHVVSGSLAYISKASHFLDTSLLNNSAMVKNY